MMTEIHLTCWYNIVADQCTNPLKVFRTFKTNDSDYWNSQTQEEYAWFVTNTN